jgi:hypothetical protein
MATYVLVAGAWLGGWAWDTVASRLREHGHEVQTLTLSGLGDRAGGGAELVDLERQVAHIVEAIERADLRDVVLVGHSFGGWPVTGAADRVPERLAPRGVRGQRPGPGWGGLPGHPPSAYSSGDPEGRGRASPADATLGGARTGQRSQRRRDHSIERAAIRKRSPPQPFATYPADPADEPRPHGLPHVLVSCSLPLDQVKAMIPSGHPWFAELAGPQWSFAELPTGHWPMVSEPVALADVLHG